VTRYRLDFDEDVAKELTDPKRYTAKVARQLLVKIVELTSNPRPQDHIQLKDGFRVDSGEHRIYYEIDDRQRVVTVRLVGPRNDDAIYKELRRKLGK
jgi:mRNA-degrading endonuclease RelE of RelBE toxin-antitoxin system